MANLKENHRFEDSLLVTFSGFGRSVALNTRGDTGHNTATYDVYDR